MRTLRIATITVLVGAAVLSLSAGCATRGDESSSTVALSSSVAADEVRSARGQMGTRQVSLNATGTSTCSLEVDSTTNSGIVVLDNHKIVIESDSVLYRGKEVMKLAPESKNVDIIFKSGRVTISDGVGSETFRL